MLRRCPFRYTCEGINNKKAELLQRRPRDAPNYGCPEKFLEPLTEYTPTATGAGIFNGLLFRSMIHPMNMRTKF